MANNPKLPYISTDANAFFSEYSRKAMQHFYIVHNDELKMYNQL